MHQRRLALLIATYEHDDSDLSRLTAPAADVEALAEVLSNPAVAGFEVTTLVNEPHYRVGQAIGEFYRDCRRTDLTLLYFTGHGLKDEDGRLYLAMANTRRDSLLFTALPAAQLDQAIDKGRSRQKVIILDCCYSGAFPPGFTPKGHAEADALDKLQGQGRIVLTASDSMQYSFEGNHLVGEGAQSVFTNHLVTGLREGHADLDRDGDITLDELYDYVYDRVIQQMPHQHPKKQANVEGRIVIARNINWTLPSHLLNSLNSPIASDRRAALDELTRLYSIGNTAVRLKVTAQVERLMIDDSKTVSDAASAWSQAIREAAEDTQPEPTDQPPAAPAPPRPSTKVSKTPSSQTNPLPAPSSQQAARSAFAHPVSKTARSSATATASSRPIKWRSLEAAACSSVALTFIALGTIEGLYLAGIQTAHDESIVLTFAIFSSFVSCVAFMLSRSLFALTCASNSLCCALFVSIGNVLALDWTWTITNVAVVGLVAYRATRPFLSAMIAACAVSAATIPRYYYNNFELDLFLTIAALCSGLLAAYVAWDYRRTI